MAQAPLPLLALLAVALACLHSCAALELALLGDWGGSPHYPLYTTPEQLQCAAALAAHAQATPIDALLALGDNFYNQGLCNNHTLAPYNNSCPNTTSPLTGTAHDPRFAVGFEAVYNAAPLSSSSSSFPFYVIAGNHDALGNVSASIAYTALSPSGRWRHPDFWYRLAFPLPHAQTLEVLMLDTTLCYGIWNDPAHDAQCAAQLAWLQAQLAASTAEYLFLAGHYPAYSPCAHGNTQWTLDTLLPLLAAHNATGYLSGHDHCGALVAPPAPPAAPGADLVYVVSGTGDGCCYNESNILAVPSGSLKYLLSQGYAQGAPSGFAALSVAPRGAASSTLTVRFYTAAANGTRAPEALYASPLILPRTPIRSPATGAVTAMAAPDYAAAGLPRPSAVAPHAPYPTAPPGQEAASVDHEEALPAVAAAAAAAAAAERALAAPSAGAPAELVLWLYAPSALDNATWSAWYSELAAHRANVTGVAPCLYLVQVDGSFVSQMPSAAAAALARGWTARMARELGLAALPLIAASGSGMNLLLRPGSGAAAAAFIAATVAELDALGGAGYNLQLEEPGNATIQAEWKAFVGAWADALAPRTLSVIIGGDCRGRDWMWMDCGDYRVLQASHPNLRAITEATYEKEPSAWLQFERNIVRGLGLPVAQLGLEYGPPLLNAGNGCLPAAWAAGVRALYVWVNPPGANSTDWDALGWWVGHQ